MIQSIPITTLLNVDPTVAVRAQRLQFAIDLLKQRASPSEVQRRVRRAFHCSRTTAWRTVSAAQDLAA